MRLRKVAWFDLRKVSEWAESERRLAPNIVAASGVFSVSIEIRVKSEQDEL